MFCVGGETCDTEEIFKMMLEGRAEPSVQNMKNRQYIQARAKWNLTAATSLVAKATNSEAFGTSED